MKKLMTVLLSLSFLGATAMFAQVPAATPDKKADTAKKKAAKKTTEKKDTTEAAKKPAKKAAKKADTTEKK
jgi:hypothetical protein